MKWTFTLELSVCRIGTKVLRILETQLGDQGVRFYFCLSTFVLYKMFKFHKNTKVHKEPLFSFIRPLLHCAETDPLPAHFMKPKRIVIKLHNSFTYFTKKYLTILRNIIYVCLRFFFFFFASRLAFTSGESCHFLAWCGTSKIWHCYGIFMAGYYEILFVILLFLSYRVTSVKYIFTH